MYTIPENFNVNILKDKIINQICYAISQISLSWDEGCIRIMGPFSLTYRDDIHFFKEVYPVENDYQLLNLLEKKIIQIDIKDTRDALILHFENEFILTLYSDIKYESFEIDDNGSRLIF